MRDGFSETLLDSRLIVFLNSCFDALDVIVLLNGTVHSCTVYIVQPLFDVQSVDFLQSCTDAVGYGVLVDGRPVLFLLTCFNLFRPDSRAIRQITQSQFVFDCSIERVNDAMLFSKSHTADFAL